MTEQELRELIELKYGSVRQMALKVNMPASTINSILNRGILNSNVDNIFKICSALGIRPETLADGVDFHIGFDVPREPSNTNIIHGDNHGINGLDAGSGNTYNFGVNDNVDSHNESMKALGIADMKMSRALLNAQNETVKKLDRIIELLEEQNSILKEIKE